MKSKIISILTMVLTVASIIFSIMAIRKNNPSTNISSDSLGIVIFALILFILAQILEQFGKKGYSFVPVLLIVLFSSQSVGIIYGNQTSTDTYSFPILELVISALLFVSLVFALKNKRWASIIVIVLLALMALTAYSTYENLKMTLNQNSNFSDYFQPEIDPDLIEFEKAGSLSTLSIYITLIVYFSKNVISQSLKKTEEVTE